MKSRAAGAGAGLEASLSSMGLLRRGGFAGRRGGDPVREGEDPPERRLLAEHLDELEERRRRERAGQREADRLGEGAEGESALGGEPAGLLLERGVRERGDGGEARRELPEDAARFRLCRTSSAPRRRTRPGRRRRSRAPPRAPSASGTATGGARSRGSRSAGSRSGIPNGRSRSTSAAGSMPARYWPFSQRSFSWSKREGEGPIRSSEKRRTISSIVIFSRSSPGDQPRRARKFASASGRKPCSRNSSTPAAPWRLESFLPSAPRIIPRCAKTGARRRGRGRARRASACWAGGRRPGRRA